MAWEYDEDEMDSGGMAKAGVYLAEVSEAEQRRSVIKGAAMGNITFVDANTRKLLCYDNLMLEGSGVGIGLKKALNLGVAERFVDEETGKKRVRVYDVQRWKGARCVIKLVEGSYMKNGEKKKRMEPDFNSDGFGYALEAEWDEIKAKNPDQFAGEDPDDADIPF